MTDFDIFLAAAALGMPAAFAFLAILGQYRANRKIDESIEACRRKGLGQ